MLFGRYPFCDRTLVGLFIKIGRCRPDIPRTISFKARSLLRSLIRVRPHERLSADDILGHVWFTGDRELSTLTSIGNDHISTNTSFNHDSNSHQATTTNDDAIVPSLLL
jgi:serine/threonine protein kinase